MSFLFRRTNICIQFLFVSSWLNTITRGFPFTIFNVYIYIGGNDCADISSRKKTKIIKKFLFETQRYFIQNVFSNPFNFHHQFYYLFPHLYKNRSRLNNNFYVVRSACTRIVFKLFDCIIKLSVRHFTHVDVPSIYFAKCMTTTIYRCRFNVMIIYRQ